jgi:hypothetical protein
MREKAAACMHPWTSGYCGLKVLVDDPNDTHDEIAQKLLASANERISLFK